MTALVLGCDPGKTGALALLDPVDFRLMDVADMPDATGAALGAAIAALLADHAPYTVREAWIEQVHAMPGQGVTSMFNFGANYGAIGGALGALGIPVHTVTPGKWKKTAGLNADKGASRQRARELWPAQADQFARVKDDGRAEACLVALHGCKESGR
jgi:crossover junction endodeoxyribonuclease RuvC